MKIAILTFSDAVNYGAMLQCYALKSYISKNYNNTTVDILNYLGEKYISGRSYYRKIVSIRSLIINIILLLDNRFKNERKKLIELFDDFRVKELGINNHVISDGLQLERAIEQYDMVIVGSDQVWNLTLTNDKNYFLPFKDKHPNIRFCSYAASIADSITNKNIDIYINLLRDFANVSFREKQTSELFLKKGISCVDCIDPVFLLKRSDWYSFSAEGNDFIDEPYVFVFLVGKGSNDQSIIKKIKKIYGFETCFLNLFPFNHVQCDKTIKVASIYDFVNFISKATVVVTDSFHATALSIILNKRFYSIRRSTRNNRIENILSFIHLNSALIDTPNDILYRKYSEENIQYDDSLLLEKIRASKIYLDKILL